MSVIIYHWTIRLTNEFALKRNDRTIFYCNSPLIYILTAMLTNEFALKPNAKNILLFVFSPDLHLSLFFSKHEHVFQIYLDLNIIYYSYSSDRTLYRTFFLYTTSPQQTVRTCGFWDIKWMLPQNSSPCQQCQQPA